jgi:DNA-directed RNA polymerase subunit RPC12/RpoP
MARTLQMFERPKVPRVARMHVIDAGHSDDMDEPLMVQYRCRRCSRESEWMTARSVTEAKRGIPCPDCNQSTTQRRSEGL